MAAYNRIVCATDFSEASTIAVEQSASLAQDLGATLHLLHVVQDPIDQPWMLEAPGIDFAKLSQEWVDNAQAELARTASTCPIRPVTACRVGRPVPNIIGYLRDVKADLLVVGTHGQGPLAQMLLGSVAERLIRQAPCPVLTARPRVSAPLPTETVAASTHSAVADPHNPIV